MAWVSKHGVQLISASGKLWSQILAKGHDGLRNRELEDILIAVVDGLRAFRGDYPDFPVGERGDLHRALEPLLSVGLRLEGAPGPGSRTQSHLQGQIAEIAPKRLSDFDAGPWGTSLAMRLAPQLGTNRSFLQFRPGGAKDTTLPIQWKI